MTDLVEVTRTTAAATPVPGITPVIYFNHFYGPRSVWAATTQKHIFPIVYQDYPLRSKQGYSDGGALDEKYFLELFFLDRMPKPNVDVQIEVDHRPIINRMRRASRQFQLRLEQNTAIDEIVESERIEMVNFLNMELSGIWLRLTLTLVDTDPICLT